MLKHNGHQDKRHGKPSYDLERTISILYLTQSILIFIILCIYHAKI